jgi:hypothetical protein
MKLIEHLTEIGCECEISKDHDFCYLTVRNLPIGFAQRQWHKYCVAIVQRCYPTCKLLTADQLQMVFQLGTLFDLITDSADFAVDQELLMARMMSSVVEGYLDAEILKQISALKKYD